MELTNEQYQILLEITKRMHPELGADNYTALLIFKAMSDQDNISNKEFFDLGKFYNKMFKFINGENPDELLAVLALKHLVYSIK